MTPYDKALISIFVLGLSIGVIIGSFIQEWIERRSK